MKNLHKDRPIINYIKMKWERLWKTKRKPYQCPYENISCTEVDTSGMDKISCVKCEHYGDGVRLTGAILDIGLKEFWNKWHLYILWTIAAVLLIITWIVLGYFDIN